MYTTGERPGRSPEELTSKKPTSWLRILVNSVERRRRMMRFCTKVNKNTFQKRGTGESRAPRHRVSHIPLKLSSVIDATLCSSLNGKHI